MPEKPGHLVMRKWVQKGKEQGYVSVPFASAVRRALSEPDVNICLVGRREVSDAVSKAWQKVIDEIPIFDISGEVNAPADLDPLEPAWDVPLDDQVPGDQDLREMMRDERVLQSMEEKFMRGAEELDLRRRGSRKDSEAKVFRKVVEELPEELRQEEFRGLVRSSVLEILKLLWSVHYASDGARLRWRFVCTDEDADIPSWPESLRAYFILAGEELDFIPTKYVDPGRLEATKRLSEEQTRRQSSEDWASSVTFKGTNATEALKRVPAGWTTMLKGEQYMGTQGRGATFRLPRTGRRVKIEVELLQGASQVAPAQAEGSSADTGESEATKAAEEPKEGGATQWLGPLAGLTAGLIALAKNTPPFQFGKKRRTEVNDVLRALQKRPEKNYDQEVLNRFEQRLWMDFGTTDEAPVVLVLGGQSETGRVISRKLVTSGYHVVLLKGGADGSQPRVQRMLPQGAVLASTSVKKNLTPVGWDVLPMDLYEAVAGIDKLVVCCCDKVGRSARLSAQEVKNVLACWQIYRSDFSEAQRAYSTKVRLFNFDRQTDFELWDLERNRPSDLCYGLQRAGWTRNSENNAMFIGQFLEPVGQAQLKSPELKLNFKRFSGLLLRAYNQKDDNAYYFFLRTSDFEETRVQYEAKFTCKASAWRTVRLPFNAFRPVRVDGVPLPEKEADARPLDRSDVVQMGITVRLGEYPKQKDGDFGAFGYFSLALRSIKAMRSQAEPQVVYMGREVESGITTVPGAFEDEDEQEDDIIFSGDDLSFNEELDRKVKAEEAAAAELQELEAILQGDPGTQDSEDLDFFDVTDTAKTPMQAVVESGLAYTIIKVKGINEHPGGKYPIHVQQDSIHITPLSSSHDDLRQISRGDAAELVVSAIMEPACVNTELAVGEVRRHDAAEPPVESHADNGSTSFEISSTMSEDVKSYLKKLTPNR